MADSVVQDSINQDTTKMTHQYQIPANIPHGVFRTYDIRGEAGEGSIDANLAYAIGLAVGSEAKTLGRDSMIVGRDGRLSGPELTAALITGLRETGINVINIGMVPTPMVYFATNQLDTDSGVMVTASHNPGHHNGFKIVLAGKTLTTQGVQDLYQRIKSNDLIKTDNPGTLSDTDVVDDYTQYIKNQTQLARPLKVVIDCGNGVAGASAPAVLRAIGCEVIELFCDVDGHFPNHHPDPTVPDNLKDIIRTVKETSADIGLALDGDADRLGVVTNEGDIIWPDRQMMLFAQDVLSRLPGSKVIFDVKCSSNLPKVIAQSGGEPIMYRTGHSLIKQKMLDSGAPIAGEMSGHIFFKEDWFGFDDGLYVGVRLLKILAKENITSSELFARLPDSVNTPELKLPMPEERKADFMRQLGSDANFGANDIITIDGLRFDFGFGWGLIRPSNTSPYLIIRFEADTVENLNQLQAIFRRELLAIDGDLQLPF